MFWKWTLYPQCMAGLFVITASNGLEIWREPTEAGFSLLNVEACDSTSD